MKKYLRTLILVASLLVPFAAFAQTHTITVADGTATDARVPIYGNFNDSYQRSQTIYPATMLTEAAYGTSMTGGVITSLTYYLSTPAADSWDTNYFTVQLMEVTGTTLSAFLDTTNAVTVYAGSINGQDSVLTINFTTPYTYQGGNLLIQFTNHRKSIYSNAIFSGMAATGASFEGKNTNSVAAISGIVRNFIPKTTFAFTGGTVIGCNAVMNLEISAVTPTTMTLSWVDTLNGSGTTYSIYNILNDSLIASAVAGTTYTATGLEPNHLYGFKVEANCSASSTSFRVSVAGRTDCANITMPYFEPFDSLANNTTPTCWLSLNGTNQVYQNTANANSGDNCLRMKGSLDNIIVMPPIEGGLSGKQAYFYHRPETYHQRCGSLTVGYITDIADTSTFVAVSTFPYTLWDSPVLYHEAEVNFNNVPAGARLAFRHNPTHTSYYWFIDDLEIFPQPTCFRPSNVEQADATETSVTLSWTDSQNSGVTYTVRNWPDSTIVATGITGTSYTVTNLQPNTSYVFAVSANCSATDESRWFPLRVLTECGPVEIPYTINFDEEQLGDHPRCWDHPTHVSSTSNVCQVGGVMTHSGSHALLFDYSDSTNANMVVLPATTESLDQLRLRFWHRAESATDVRCGVMEVGYLTNPDFLSTFVPVDTLVQSNVYERVTVTFSNAPANSRIAFRHRAVGLHWRWVVDDLTIEEVPACGDVDSLTVTALTDNTASFTWSASNATSYEVWVRLGDSVVSTWQGAATAATVGNLEYGHDYTAVVRGICASGPSEWSLPVSFHLAYCTPNATSCDGQGITNVTFGIGEVVNNSEVPASAPYYGNYTAEVGAVIPGMPNEIQITFQTGYSYGTVIWIDWNRSMTFDDDEIVYTGMSTNASPTTITATLYIDPLQDTGLYRMRIGAADSYFDNFVNSGEGNHSPCAETSWAIFKDFTVHVIETPSCFPVFGVVASDITGNSATLSWIDTLNSGATYSITDGTTVLASGITATSYTVTGLTATTLYTLGVVAHCSANSASLASTVSFWTGCDVTALPLEESFEENSSTIHCWELVSMNNANAFGTYNGMDYVTIDNHRMLRFSSYSSASDYNQYAFSPVFAASDNANGLNVRIRYATYGNEDHLYFGYVTATDTVWDQQSYNTTGQSNMAVYTATLPVDATQIAIRYYGNYQYYGWIDSVVVNEVVGPQQYTVTVNYDAQQGTVTGAGTFDEGTMVTLTATAAEGYVFDGWVEGDSTVITNPYSFALTADRTLTALFREVVTYTVTVNYDPEKGSVSGAGTYGEGVGVTLTATANENYEFVGWIEGEDLIEVNPYTFTITSDRTFTASFRTVTGIDDVESSMVTLYPNPASTTVTIDGLTAGSRVALLDLNGRVMSEFGVRNSELKIDLTGYAKGAYFVRIVDARGTTVRKLIVR